jgi:hypothetical protein
MLKILLCRKITIHFWHIRDLIYRYTTGILMHTTPSLVPPCRYCNTQFTEHFCVVTSSALQPWVGLGFLMRFRNNFFFFLRGEVVILTSNPQPGGPGYFFLSGSSPLTCLAWEALPVAYTTTSTAFGIIWPHKPHHYAKVRIPSGGCSYFILIKYGSGLLL